MHNPKYTSESIKKGAAINIAMTMAWGNQIEFVSVFMFVVLTGLRRGGSMCYFVGERNSMSRGFRNDRHEKRWVSQRSIYS